MILNLKLVLKLEHNMCYNELLKFRINMLNILKYLFSLYSQIYNKDKKKLNIIK